jgi:broad specificity phosphatase PhoE
MTEPELRQAYPEVWTALTNAAGDFRWPGGETGTEAQARIVGFVREKQVQHAGERVLVVCHDGLIRLWMCSVLGLPVWRRGDFQTTFCGLTEMRAQPASGRWKLVRFNQDCGAG